MNLENTAANFFERERKIHSRQICFDDDIEESGVRPGFDCFWIDEQMVEFSEANDADKWLEDNGVKELYGKSVIGANILQEMCRVWGKDKAAVFNAAGASFLISMREIMYHVYLHKYGVIAR